MTLMNIGAVDILERLHGTADIGMRNLDPVDVHQVVCSFLELPANTEKIEELSAIVAKRTAGHPYHVLM
jgi:hypothetical protein